MPRPLILLLSMLEEYAHQGFYWLLNMSISGTLAGAIVWLIGRWPRLPRRIAHGLWLIPALRLTLPFSFGSAFSLARLLPERAVTYVPLLETRELTMTNAIQYAVSYNPIAYRDARITVVLTLAFLAWLAVLLGLLSCLLAAHLASRRGLRAARLLQKGVYCAPDVSGPMVCGVLRPRILIPEALADSDLTHILAHERAHIRRLDNLWRTLAILIACIHWFNPAVWLMLRAFLREAEAACDESVVSRLDAQGRSAYARALVDAAETRAALASPLGGGRLRSRVSRILTYRRLTLASALGFLALAAALAWALLSNPL